jgi:hypothetical protein
MEEENISEYIEQLQGELKNKDEQLQKVSGAYSTFSQQQDQNLIVWQLELDNILERIEHLLRGDVVVEDEDGNIDYAPPTDTDLIVLNDYGVKLIMNVISFYLNRNTILSHYDNTRIFQILYDLGIELADLIYTCYNKMGLNTTEKKARYPMLTMNILHTIESAYNRSLRGGERDSLRSARVVTQTEPIGGGYTNQQKEKFKLFKPTTWT